MGTDDPLEAREVLARVGLALVVALVIAVVAGALPLFPTGSSVEEPASYPAYDSEDIAPERIEAEGTVAPSPADSNGVVLIDDAHTNDLDREDVNALVTALVRAGYEVQFFRGDRSLSEALNGSDAFVVIDPREGYDPGEVDTVETFVENGGRMLLVGEPNIRTITVGIGGPTITTERSRVDALASPFGLAFGSNYLYDMESNDGNFRSIVGRPPDGSPVTGVDRVALSTATTVRGRNATTLLETPRSTRQADATGEGPYPVAARSGGVVAVGDGDFMNDDRYNVADTEVFVTYVAEFLVAGDFVPPENFVDEGDDSEDGGGGDGGDGGTQTPTPTPPVTPNPSPERAGSPAAGDPRSN